MIGVLIVSGIIFYAVLYSGVQDLQGTPISVLDALTGKGAGGSSKGGATLKGIGAGTGAGGNYSGKVIPA